jgi:transposase
MKLIKITPEELLILKRYFQTSPISLIRNKAQAIIMKSQGLTFDQIGSFLFKGAKAISRWIKDFLERRLASLFSGHVNNQNASKLTKEQKESIKHILTLPPSEYGLPKEFWDVPQLKSYVEARFGIIYESDQSYHFLLKFCDLTFKYPDTFSLKRDESAIEKRIKEIREEIKVYLNDPEWEVFAADETRMALEALTRQAWLHKGKRTVIKVNQTNVSQSYFGALNQKNFKCCVFELDWQNQEEILPALKKLIDQFPKKKICIVWDNARFHKGKLIKEALAKGNLLERVHLINFPPYAPDYNPIEKVWNTVKSKLANKQFDSFDITKNMFLQEVNSRTFAYKI